MSWIYLTVAGLLEVVWAVSMKRTEGFTKLGPSLFTLAFMAVSFYLLGRAVKELPIGTAYAVWTGIGAAGTALYGVFVAGEPAGFLRIACILLILGGTLGLKLTHV